MKHTLDIVDGNSAMAKLKNMSGFGDPTAPFFRPTLNFVFHLSTKKDWSDFYSICKKVSKNFAVEAFM